VRETVMATVGGAGLTFKNSHKSIMVRITINTQSARSIDGDLLCVYSFII